MWIAYGLKYYLFPDFYIILSCQSKYIFLLGFKPKIWKENEFFQ